MNLLTFKQPVIVNGLKAVEQLHEEMQEFDDSISPIYIHADFVKPGKHHYCISDPNVSK